MLDITHFYVEKGSGEPLILLHGNGEDGSYFAHQMQEFSSDYRVIAVDTRGHGKTPRGSAPFTIRQFAEDLAEFLEVLGIENANILGFSDGANIAMCFASKYPDHVRKLVLNGGNLNAEGMKPAVQIPIEIEYRFAKLFASKSEKANKNMEMLGLMVNEPNITAEELQKITAKTLVIVGTKDMVKQGHSEFIANHIKNAELKMVEGDHFAASKNPEAFNFAVKTFLRKI